MFFNLNKILLYPSLLIVQLVYIIFINKDLINSKQNLEIVLFEEKESSLYVQIINTVIVTVKNSLQMVSLSSFICFPNSSLLIKESIGFFGVVEGEGGFLFLFASSNFIRSFLFSSSSLLI